MPAKIKKEPPPTKLELHAQLAALRVTNENLQRTITRQAEENTRRDTQLRERFSKVLGAPPERSSYTYGGSSGQVYSWEEIFCEVGKLLSVKSVAHFEEWKERVDEDLRRLQEVRNEH